MLSFLAGDGEQARRIRDHDWTATPLGPPERWPVALKTLVGVMLGAEQPMFVAWGPERTLLYNDAYSLLLADRHPHALGCPFMDVWAEARADLAPLFDRVFAGEPVHMDDIELGLDRPGRPREAHFAFSYTPVRTEGGAVAGLFCPCTETTEQILGQRSLRAERDRYTTVLDGMAEGFALIGPDFRILQVNDEAMRLETRGRDEIVGRLVWDAYPGTEDGPVGLAYRRVMAERVPVAVEHRYRWPDGREAWIDLRAYPVADGLAAFYRDVTERRRTEEALRASEARLRAVFDTVPVGIVLADAPTGRITGGNAQAEAIFGHPVLPSADADAYGESISTHADGRRVEAHEYPLTPVIRGEADRAELEVLYRRGDGRDAWVRLIAAPITDDAGRITGGLVASLDIDREKRAEADLRRLNEDLEHQVAERTAERDRLWRNTQDIQVIIDGDGVFRAVNPAFTTILGWPPGEVIGRTVFDFVLPDDEAPTEGALTHARLETLPTFENRYRHKDGGLRWISWVATPEDTLIYASGRDVTADRAREAELAEAQDQLRQAQKMEAVGQLTGGIAHDFNNLLTGVIGSLDMMQRRLARGESDKVERYATAAMTSANRAAALTHRLLAFSRRQPLDPKPVNANRLVTGMEELLRRTIGESVALEIVTAGGLWQTLCDAHQLENAVLNLAINARDAMADGGHLTIETCNARLDDAYAARERDVRPGQYVCICVTDTGTGMSKDTIAKAFEPFFTTKPIGQGTGLGLSMIYGFTRQSEGYARIYSEVGQGTTVKLYLPRYYGETEEADEGQDELTDDHRAETGEVVLVVEDEAAVRDLVVDLLQELGYRAVEAADGPTGLKLLQGDMRCDLLVTDIGLPGLNGRQLADAARVGRPDLRVLFMTGYAENATLANGFLEPGMEMMTKPFAVEALAQRIRDMIGA